MQYIWWEKHLKLSFFYVNQPDKSSQRQRRVRVSVAQLHKEPKEKGFSKKHKHAIFWRVKLIGITAASVKESFKLTQFMSVNVHFSFLELRLGSSRRERLCRPALGGQRSYSAARVAAGFAVVPVAAQVNLQRQQTVGRGAILAALIWDTVNMWCHFSAGGQTIHTVRPFQANYSGRLPGGSVGQGCRVQVCLDTGLVSGSQPRTSSLPW